MIAVIPVRDGVLPIGADEAVDEAGGRVLVVGEGADKAADVLAAAASVVMTAEAGRYAPAGWSAALAPHLAGEDVVLLPHSPDGRDLAPRLAHALGRTLLAGAASVAPGLVVVPRLGGRTAVEHRPTGPFVATLQPGVRGVDPRPAAWTPPAVQRLDLGLAGAGPDAEVLEVTPPDPTTMDLSEASFIVAGGAGLGSPEAFGVLAEVGAALGASVGGTRVVTDAGWLPFERQIGTTGIAVSPRLYLAFGISGAVQHTTGLGAPEHILSVNVDASCPMMTMADVAVVADAPAVLDELAARLRAGGEREEGGR